MLLWGGNNFFFFVCCNMCVLVFEWNCLGWILGLVGCRGMFENIEDFSMSLWC